MTKQWPEQGPTMACEAVELPKGWTRKNSIAYEHTSGLIAMLTAAHERDGHTWKHLSVSGKGRLPTWRELSSCKKIFLGPQALAVQVFVPQDEHVNDMPHCLHLWQRIGSRPTPDFRRMGTV